MNNYYQRFKTIEERFWEKVAVRGDDECWEWLASKVGPLKYGHFWGGKDSGQIMAHRFSWIIHYGEIPEGMYVCHHCDNPPCVNPNHLFLGTYSDNMFDMWNKGRHDLDDFWSDYDTSGEGNGKSKLRRKDILQIRKLWRMGYSQIEIQKIYPNVQKPAIWKIVHRKTWKHIGD